MRSNTRKRVDHVSTWTKPSGAAAQTCAQADPGCPLRVGFLSRLPSALAQSTRCLPHCPRVPTSCGRSHAPPPIAPTANSSRLGWSLGQSGPEPVTNHFHIPCHPALTQISTAGQGRGGRSQAAPRGVTGPSLRLDAPLKCSSGGTYRWPDIGVRLASQEHSLSGCTCVPKCAYMCTWVCTCVCVYTCTPVCTRVFVCARVHAHMCV